MRLRHGHSTWDEVIARTGEVLSVAPDLVAELEHPRPTVLFVEVQGTAPSLRAVTAKVVAFREYLGSGMAEERYGQGTRFKILFVAFSNSNDDRDFDDHTHNIAEAASGQGLDRLVYCASLRRVLDPATGSGGAVWLRPYDLAELLATLPEREQLRLTDAAHSRSNQTRWDRDALITKAGIRRSLFR